MANVQTDHPGPGTAQHWEIKQSGLIDITRMNAKAQNLKHEELQPAGRALLVLIIEHVRTAGFRPGDPRTYLGYKECCVALGVAPDEADLPWGRLLQQNGLNELNGWTQRNDFPRVTGLVVHQGGERQYWPGGDFFRSNHRPDMDGEWWEQQALQAATFDWESFL